MELENRAPEMHHLIEERVRAYERELTDHGDTDITAFLDGLEGEDRSSLIGRLVEVEDIFHSAHGDVVEAGGSSRPSHPRFRLIRELGAGGMGIVYEAWDREREMPVALKTVQRLDANFLMLFKKEFRSLAKIVHPNLISLYELFSDGDQWFFSMELVADGRNLRDALRGSRDEEATLTSELTSDVTMDLATSVASSDGAQIPGAVAVDLDYDRVRALFSQVAEGVIALHDEDKLHRDLKPGNVLVRGDDRVALLDFGLVADIDRRWEVGADGDISSGGVVASGGAAVGTISYMAPEQAAAKELGTCSDWYAVGVMLFEVLTGRLPFEGTNTEKIRQKLTQAPPRASSFNPTVPADLDQLCFELVQRNSEDRPAGDDVISRLTQGQSKRQGAFLEGRQFIGRERELAALRLAIAKASEGETAIFHLHGRSGVGKSALVQRFLDEVEENGSAMVLSGRCYEQEKVPYKAFDSVVDTLATELNRMPPHLVEDALPPGIPALARVFPVLGSVPAIAALGQVPMSQDLEGLRKRAFVALRRLLSNLARYRTLVVYIDDLQWGDLDSADLMAEILLPDDRPPMLLLLAYRSEYLDRSPALAAINALGEEPESVLSRTLLSVDALSSADTRRLAASILLPIGSPEQIEWVVQESEGIAFFVNELALFAREAGPRQIESGTDLEKVLWDRISRYPAAARELLKTVAVAGQPLTLKSAQAAAGVGMIAPEVLASLRAGNLLRGSGTGLLDQVESYHDRVREIVTGRLEDERLRTIHAALAATFEVHGEGGPERLARHYVESGQREAAGRNFETAADQAVHALAVERAEEFFRKAIELAGTDEERALRQEKIIHFYTDSARFTDAYGTGRKALAALGVSLPEQFKGPPFVADLARARFYLGWRKIPSLIDLPTASDPKHTLAIRLLSAVGKAAYQIRPELCIAVLVKSVNACLAKGNTGDAAVGFMAFGSIFLGGILGRHRDGYEFGRLSLDLVEKYEDDIHRAEVNFVVGYFGTSWLKPSQSAEELFDRAFTAGQESGDLFHTGCACAAGAMHRFMRGVPLAEMLEETDRHIAFLGPLRLRETLGCVRSTRQAVLNLTAQTASRTSFSDVDFDESSFVDDLAAYGSRHFAHYHHINRMIVMTHWCEIDAGLEAADASLDYLKESKGMLHSAEHYFYRALMLAAAERAGRGRGRRGLSELRRTARRFAGWASHCPENFLARAHMLQAELALLRKAPKRALSFYAVAAETAQRYRHLHIAALAHRNAAGVLDAQGEAEAAADQRSTAAECYRCWGSEPLADFWGGG